MIMPPVLFKKVRNEGFFMKYYVLFNPLAGNGRGVMATEELISLMKGDSLDFCDMTKIKSYGDFFDSAKGCPVIICGGDGTLNRFVNDTAGINAENDIFYYATGSGNDFLNDLEKKKGEPPFKINKYLKNLPTVTVNGKSSLFLNAIGYGIDGYCCEEGDKKRTLNGKSINYTPIAVKGLFGGYTPANAVITLDGKEMTFKKVWLAPTMNGRYFGGGMMAAPNQNRLNPEHTVALMVMNGKTRLNALCAFPSIFKGEHITKHADIVKEFFGREITVKFDRPTALQIDGETIPGVLEYSVSTAKTAKDGKPAAAATV